MKPKNNIDEEIIEKARTIADELFEEKSIEQKLTRSEGTVRREIVSNIEIWCECFGRAKEDMKPADSYAIAALMVKS